MTDLERILPLWRELETSGADYVLATIVAVEGSSYRKPGAHMLLAQDGRRAGTVSGGCLEAEVARRAWWLTSAGPVVERYSTADDDGDRPSGSGCGGVVFLLLERRQTAGPRLVALEAAFKARTPLGIATVLEGTHIGRRAYAGLPNDSEQASDSDGPNSIGDIELTELAALALDRHTSFETKIPLEGVPTRVWADYRAARPGLWIFSAGDDAKPLAQLARELGWYVAVADGRSHLATRERFPAADEVCLLPIADLPDAAPAHLSLLPTDAAVVMTHSFEQDSRVLASLLALEFPLAYLGVLGPQRRTRELLAEAAGLLHLSVTTERVDQWLAEMHAPTGLDLGADTPAAIALSVVAEIQKVITAATGEPLRQVRAAKHPIACF
jgi:xanthine/CO dehydrogenase XdhC/CoxF family maturation factor